uniref:15-oxoprostaglandin 13-reductase n=1 Tax=Neolamprologus brichardi TaxID=32507 RepID=A0A3Q4GID0_NEOBR
VTQGKSWVMTQHFDGFPKKSNFGLKVEELPEPKDGDVLLEAVFSVDPYMKFSQIYMKEIDLMIGSQVNNTQTPFICFHVSLLCTETWHGIHLLLIRKHLLHFTVKNKTA